MTPRSSETPFLAGYLILFAVQFPVWMVAGMCWALGMTLVFAHHPIGSFVGGLAWGFFMWLVCGNIFAIGLAWRKSTEFPAPNREEFLATLGKVGEKIRLKILSESANEVVLGPKKVLVRFRLQETRVAFKDGRAVLTGPALSMWGLKRRLKHALAQPPVRG
jgi:hypothetical protein